MANRCKKCGVPLSEGAKFCRTCGTPVMQPESAGIKPESRRTEPQRYTPPQPQPYQQAGPETDNLTGNQQKSKRKLFGRQAKATSQKQTRTFAAGTSAAAAGAAYAGGQAGNAAASERTAAPGPAYADGRYPGLGEYLKSYIRKISDILKDPKQLLPTIVLGAIWMVLSIVGSFFWRLPLPLSILSFLTYAQGGMYGGFLAAAGGIVGKVVVAAFLNAMIMPLFKGGKPFDGVAGGIGGVFKGAAVQGIQELSPLTLGVGAALVLYGFMNSRQSLQEAMVGIVAVIMLLKNIGTKGGFMLLLKPDFGVTNENLMEADIRSLSDVTGVSAAAEKFCLNHGQDAHVANRIALCIEEMAANVIQHGFSQDQKPHHLMVRVLHKPDHFVLRFRDDCRAFDPLHYVPEEGRDALGIGLVLSMADEAAYTYSLNMNNLTIRLGKGNADK